MPGISVLETAVLRCPVPESSYRAWKQLAQAERLQALGCGPGVQAFVL